ncbi:hypothetical protein Dimus_020619 [Dionaea muscipula]
MVGFSHVKTGARELYDRRVSILVVLKLNEAVWHVKDRSLLNSLVADGEPMMLQSYLLLSFMRAER